jgi:hypothetical protein
VLFGLWTHTVSYLKGISGLNNSNFAAHIALFTALFVSFFPLEKGKKEKRRRERRKEKVKLGGGQETGD